MDFARRIGTFKEYLERSRIMSYLTRQQILDADDLKTEEVNVPEWGGVVVVKAMTGTERDAFEASTLDKRNPEKRTFENIRAKLVSRTVIDPDTKTRLFTVADIEVLGKKSAAALDRIYTVSSKLSKVSDEDVEELLKNSSAAQSDSSTTN